MTDRTIGGFAPPLMRGQGCVPIERTSVMLNDRWCNLVSHRPQRRGQLGLALGNPAQGPHRIAKRHRFDQIAQIVKQARVLGRQRPAAAASTTDPTRRRIRSIKILQSTTDRTTRNRGCTANRGNTTVSGNPSLGRCEKPTTPLIESVPYGLIASSYGVFINHQHKI